MVIKLRHTKRYKEIIAALVHHGFGYLVEEMGLLQLLSLPRRWRRGPETPAKTLGERVRLVLEELGPAFVKLGQLSSTRQDLFPPDILRELEKLQDDVPPFPMNEVRDILERELGKPLEESYREFRETPLAAASIGQVHYARLHTDEQVAVKIQRPSVDERIRLDLEILAELVQLAERRIAWVAQYQVADLLEELSRSMLDELDYTHESRNTDAIARQFAANSHVVVPQIYWSHTTAKVLTMEYIDGIKLNHARERDKEQFREERVGERFVNAMLKQIFTDGVFHADPHPGNLLVLPGGRIVFIDFGMVGRLSEEMRFHLISFLIAMMRGDSEGLVRAVLQLGMVGEDADMIVLEREMERLREKYYEVPFAEVSLGQALGDLFKVANKHGIRIPSDLTLLGKTLLTMEGVAASIDPGLSIVSLAEPFGRKLLKERFRPSSIRKRAWKSATEAGRYALQLPKEIQQISRLIRTGKLKLDVGMPELEVILRKLDQVSNRITISIVLLSFSIVLVGLMIASSLGDKASYILHFPVMEIGSLIAGLMLLWLLYSIFKSGRS
ncbi:ABC1 kinase family protein [Gorillibacterium timonense]|uniref:ABC1 kinase family protein n=1 Tax=Gorillibacterium timonense TaxID=1689269 RepID=UPI00071C2EDE|nr:AarF/ABC1/UbiB kinase family protein [Gorillibacterium timonense]